MLIPCVQGGAGGGAVALAYLSNNEVSTANATSYTYSSKSLGSGDDVLVAIGAHTTVTSPAISSVTVGGSGATAVVSKIYNSGGQTTVAAIYRVSRPASSGDVVVNWGSNNMTSCGIGLWSMSNASGSAHATATDARVGTDTNLSASINCPAGGAIVSAIMISKAGVSTTWTNLTEKWDGLVESSTEYYSGASDVFASQQSSLAITADVGVNMDRGSMVIASFGA